MPAVKVSACAAALLVAVSSGCLAAAPPVPETLEAASASADVALEAPTPTVAVPTPAPAPTATTVPAPAGPPPAAEPALAPAAAPTLSPAPLAVPLYRQEHALSCEAAALRMALGALGIDATEEEILARLPRDSTPRRVAADGTVTWGDPDRGFVGQWDGAFARDGYGVYQEPIAEVARSFGVESATGVSGADPTDLYTVAESVPVVVWMPYGGTVKGRGWWQTPEGKRIDYVVTEHAVVLAGLDGDEVTYADPYTGAFESLPRDRFEAALAEMGNRAVLLER